MESLSTTTKKIVNVCASVYIPLQIHKKSPFWIKAREMDVPATSPHRSSAPGPTVQDLQLPNMLSSHE